MPIDTEFSYWLYKNHLEKWDELWELSKEYESEQCNIAFVSKRFYIYRLRESGNTKTFEIGYVENPKKGITYTWDDVNARICEGFWGDKVMVEKVVRLLNGC